MKFQNIIIKIVHLILQYFLVWILDIVAQLNFPEVDPQFKSKIIIIVHYKHEKRSDFCESVLKE